MHRYAISSTRMLLLVSLSFSTKHLHLSLGSQLIMIGSCHSIMSSSPPFLSLLWESLTRMCLPGYAYRYAIFFSRTRRELRIIILRKEEGSKNIPSTNTKESD
jgi:hypothetical protein